MHFNLFIIDTGHHEASWRLPESDALANTDVDYYERLARAAEAAKFDSLFLADSTVLWNDPGRRPSGRLEPITLLTALARATQRIGLIAAAAGRNPDEIKILPGIVPVLGSTEAQARALDAELDRLIVAEHARDRLALLLRVEPERLALDAPLPDDLPAEDEIEGAKSRYTLVVELGRRENLTVRELIGRLGGGRGHKTLAGTPEQVADMIEHWCTHGAADGFNIMPAVLPSGLELFAEHVVPLLQRRGLFRTEYEGTTLREHYGLARPPSQYARSQQDVLAATG
jgi:alkanesulfonate monooxygenase SsuD/methylene tetrahydromethanopterin reductase-like flavin-dependent oxidoreductase (luciferase family)